MKTNKVQISPNQLVTFECVLVYFPGGSSFNLHKYRYDFLCRFVSSRYALITGKFQNLFKTFLFAFVFLQIRGGLAIIDLLIK